MMGLRKGYVFITLEDSEILCFWEYCSLNGTNIVTLKREKLWRPYTKVKYVLLITMCDNEYYRCLGFSSGTGGIISDDKNKKCREAKQQCYARIANPYGYSRFSRRRNQKRKKKSRKSKKRRKRRKRSVKRRKKVRRKRRVRRFSRRKKPRSNTQQCFINHRNCINNGGKNCDIALAECFKRAQSRYLK